MDMDDEMLFRVYLRGAAGGYSAAPEVPIEILAAAAIGALDVRHRKSFRTREDLRMEVERVLGAREDTPRGDEPPADPGTGPMSAGRRTR